MYSLVCNEAGGILDDVIVSRFDKHWLMVLNAANREKILAWAARVAAGRATPGANTAIDDEHDVHGYDGGCARGPTRWGFSMSGVLPEPLSEIQNRYHCEQMRMMMIVQFSVFRTGYTGEDGGELICGLSAASMAANYLMKSGKEEHAVLEPAGLGATAIRCGWRPQCPCMAMNSVEFVDPPDCQGWDREVDL